MNRLRLFGLLVAVAAVFAVAVAVVSSASGATMELPEFSVTTAGTSTSGPGTLFGAEKIVCTSDKGLQGAISKTLGTYDLNFEGCTAAGGKCRSLGQVAGSNVILTTGQYHLLLTGGASDVHLLWFLTAEVHIECEILGTQLVRVKGDVLGSIAAQGTNKKEFAVKVEATSATTQKITEYENNNGTKVKAGGLLSSLNEGTFVASAENSNGTITTEKATELQK